jgi:hypothetical protein
LTELDGPHITHHGPRRRGFTKQDYVLIDTLWNRVWISRVSELCHGQRLARLSRWNFIIDLALATTASGSGISGLEVFSSGGGAVVWPYLAAATAVLAIAKPLTGIERKLRDTAELQQIYRRVYNAYEDLAFDVEQAGSLTSEHRQRFQRIRKMYQQAKEQENVAHSEAMLRPLQAHVDKEMPKDQLWRPEISPDPERV